jgi:predicted GIY-YIG superfamily endonuclease
MVYLIHFNTKFHHCQHYIGYSADDLFFARIEHHKKGTGSALVRAVNLAGIGWAVVRIWPLQDGNFERKLKSASIAKADLTSILSF